MTAFPATHNRILVTGADGFIGNALCAQLRDRNYPIRRVLRGPASDDDIRIGDIGTLTDWRAALAGVDGIIHLAARAHVMHDSVADPLAEYRRINVDATIRLARAAAAAGARRFVFLSSIKVNGERTMGKSFTEDDAPRPEDAYGISKWEAEQALSKIAAETGLEVVVLRAPLVYGPGVKGNFLTLLRAVARGVPLPLASIDNRRSLIYVSNLTGAIARCIDHPAAAGKTFLVADDVDVATPQLIRAMAVALDVPARLLPFPLPLLRTVAALLGKTAALSRLTDSLQIDDSRIRRALDWQPECALAQGLAATARWYHGQVVARSSTE